MFSDNIALVGRLSNVFPAADYLRESLQEIGLTLQPADSAIYIPSYARQETPPELLSSLREQYPDLCKVPWQREGVVLLGNPVGTDEFVHNTLTQVCDNITQRAAEFAKVDDGLIHLQLHKFSINSMLPYFLRTTRPTITVQHAQRIDSLIWEALLDFSEVPQADRDDDAQWVLFADAKCQVTLPISEGGFGLTPNECVATTVFYSGVSRALRFASSINFPPITEYLASPAFLNHPLYEGYAKARQDLIEWGAAEPDQSQPSSEGAVQPSQGDLDPCKKHKPPVLPALTNVLVHDSSKQVVFPDQRALTKLAQKAQQRWSTEGLSDEGKKRTAHLSWQSFTARCTADETATYLQGIAKFSENLKLRHSPLAWICHTESLNEKLPRDVFAVLFSFILGLRAPLCLQSRNTSTCEACGVPMDPYGHHRMTCAKTSSFHAAHAQLAEAFADTARKSGVPYTDKNVPRHLTTDKVGDALINLSNDGRQLILDYTIAHPVHGTQAGLDPGKLNWNDKVLNQKVKHKLNRHGRHYAVLGFAFAPCVMTTYGQIDAHFLRLLYILAQKRAELVHVQYRPSTPIERLFGAFFAQGRARLGAAVARGMASRALGCSSMGVSKVFLRHIAPTRYQDQTLSAGEHLDAGLTQWRFALAV
jgi:hypothetical protein